MKTKKAISWEKISEGIITAGEISEFEKYRNPINLTVIRPDNNILGSNIAASIQIVHIRSRNGKYNVTNFADDSRTIPNTGNKVNKRPYKYLSCAVRRAIGEYKAALRTNKWRMVRKA